MVSALAPKPRFAPNLTPLRAPVGKSPVRLVPTLPEPPPPSPRAGFGGAVGGALFTISALWSAKTAYDAVKAVPSQLPWMPGKPVEPNIWLDPERVAVEAHARFGHMNIGHLNTLRFVREKQSMPPLRGPMHDPHDRNLFVQNENGEWVQIPLAGQQTGALEIGTLWEHGLPGKLMHERAGDELRLIEIELGRRNFQTEKPETDADNSWFEQYANYIRELAEAMRRRANGENVPLPILVINTPEETKMPSQTKPQIMCSSINSGVSSESDAKPTPNEDVKEPSEPFSKTGDIRSLKTVLFIVAMDVEFQAISDSHYDWNEIESPFGVNGLLKHTDGDRTYYLTKSGVGPVNAALATDAIIQKYFPDAVVLLGVGGSLNRKLKIGDLVVATKILQHDSVYAGPEGATLMRPGALHLSLTPEERPAPYFSTFDPLTALISGALSTYRGTIHVGTILTGSQFAATARAKQKIAKLDDNALLVEMESGGVALACERRNIPFSVAKTVSDRLKPGGGVDTDYKTFLASSAKNAATVVGRIVKSLNEAQQ